jgi:hypothetical protein
MTQIELFTTEPELPEGFVYEPEFISCDDEQALVKVSNTSSSRGVKPSLLKPATCEPACDWIGSELTQKQ